MRGIWTLAAALACANGALAQTINKCIEGGKISYSEQPCAAGAVSSMVNVPPPASSADAQAQTQRERALAVQLERERYQRDAADARQQAREARAAAPKIKACAKLRLRKKWADDDVASAQGKQLAAAQLKARRLVDQLALECPG